MPNSSRRRELNKIANESKVINTLKEQLELIIKGKREVKDEDGNTALHRAPWQGKGYQVFFNKGAYKEIRNNQAKTLLDHILYRIE